MRLRALAKINLGLDILRKREDGYHEVRMIMQTIQMYDVLEMKRVRKPGISLSVNYSYIPNDERNLVYKAAKLLMDEFQVKGGVDIHLEKFIPVAAGMAGGSSDAAAIRNAVRQAVGCVENNVVYEIAKLVVPEIIPREKEATAGRN